MLPASKFPDVLLILSALRLQVAPEPVDDLFSDFVTAEILNSWKYKEREYLREMVSEKYGV